jgi:hypothetical protein
MLASLCSNRSWFIADGTAKCCSRTIQNGVSPFLHKAVGNVGLYKNLHTNVYRSFICNCQNLEGNTRSFSRGWINDHGPSRWQNFIQRDELSPMEKHRRKSSTYDWVEAAHIHLLPLCNIPGKANLWGQGTDSWLPGIVRRERIERHLSTEGFQGGHWANVNYERWVMIPINACPPVVAKCTI